MRKSRNKQYTLPSIEPATTLSWDNTSPVLKQKIPHYDAKYDKYCPLTQTKSFNRSQVEAVKGKPDLSNISSSSLPNWKNPLDLKLPLKGSNSLSKITYQSSESGNSGSKATNLLDLEIIRIILIRENILETLQKLQKKFLVWKGEEKAWQDFNNLIIKLRSITTEVVEKINRWSINQVDKKPFVWNNHIYLLKIITDTVFLNETPQIVDWLGCTLHRNPFIAPITLSSPICEDNIVVSYVGNTDIHRISNALKILIEAESQHKEIEKESDLQPLEEDCHDSTENFPDDACDSEVIVSNDLNLTKVENLSSDIRRTEKGIRNLEKELLTLTAHAKELNYIIDENRECRPGRLRKLQRKHGTIKNEIKFRSGDLYKRKMELERKKRTIVRIKKSKTNSSEAEPLAKLDISKKGVIDENFFQEEKLRRKKVWDKVSTENGLVKFHKNMSIEDVYNFLCSIRLKNCADILKAKRVNGSQLENCTDDMLNDLGITTRIQRSRIIKEIQICRDEDLPKSKIMRFGGRISSISEIKNDNSEVRPMKRLVTITIQLDESKSKKAFLIEVFDVKDCVEMNSIEIFQSTLGALPSFKSLNWEDSQNLSVLKDWLLDNLIVERIGEKMTCMLK